MKHTPGPWAVGWEAFSVHVGPLTICHIFPGDGNNEKTIRESNARLIAAAPEMFDYLKSLLIWCDMGPCQLDPDKLKTLIKKAEGKT